jgi:hypothetical protein
MSILNSSIFSAVTSEPKQVSSFEQQIAKFAEDSERLYRAKQAEAGNSITGSVIGSKPLTSKEKQEV